MRDNLALRLQGRANYFSQSPEAARRSDVAKSANLFREAAQALDKFKWRPMDEAAKNAGRILAVLKNEPPDETIDIILWDEDMGEWEHATGQWPVEPIKYMLLPGVE